jgi:hypothetical protein
MQRREFLAAMFGTVAGAALPRRNKPRLCGRPLLMSANLDGGTQWYLLSERYVTEEAIQPGKMFVFDRDYRLHSIAPGE